VKAFNSSREGKFGQKGHGNLKDHPLYNWPMSGNHPESELDASGLLCPLPVLKARKRLQAMPSGAVLKVVATDPMSVIDMPHFCTEQGHELLSQTEDAGHYIYLIRRG
jgi:tRNA 2-thiouridine synthesizing protein A